MVSVLLVLFLESAHFTQLMRPVGPQGPQAALRLLWGSGLAGAALGTPQPSHPDSRA